MRTETLSEKWYEFLRIYCKEGWIDRWHGDAINNPNNDKKDRMCLNSSATFVRLNNGRWYDRYSTSLNVGIMLELADDFTAEEIFLTYFNLKLAK